VMNRRDFVRVAAASLGVAAVVSSETTTSAQKPTMSLNVIYPNQEGATFDTAYYRSTHIPLAMKVMKASSVLVIEGVPNGAAAAPYAMIAHFAFPSADALQAALANPGMAEVRADVPKFTNIAPTIMFGKSV
jgi:uncharacterized protein (TIGR02118 family)